MFSHNSFESQIHILLWILAAGQGFLHFYGLSVPSKSLGLSQMTICVGKRKQVGLVWILRIYSFVLACRHRQICQTAALILSPALNRCTGWSLSQHLLKSNAFYGQVAFLQPMIMIGHQQFIGRSRGLMMRSWRRWIRSLISWVVRRESSAGLKSNIWSVYEPVATFAISKNWCYITLQVSILNLFSHSP